MYCTQCGTPIHEKDRFCSHCGRSVSGEGEARSAPPAPERRLVRPMWDKTVAGVCSGFARYLGVDVVLVRIVWLCVAVFTGTGFIAYLVCWIVMPKEYAPAPATQTAPETPPEAAPGTATALQT